MDGRVQLPVIDWIKANAQVDYVDAVTEPGPNKILSRGSEGLADSIRNRVSISVNAHGSRFVAIVAHGDCAGNPAPMNESLDQLRKAMDLVYSWGFPVRVVGLWVDSDRWQVKEIASIEPD